MDAIVRIAVLFAITTVTVVAAILLAAGELNWKTAGLVVFLAICAGAAAGIWAVVHGQFSNSVEVGLTAGIIVLGVTLLYAGGAVRDMFATLLSDNSPWWLAAPIGGTAAITLTFGLHRR